MIVVGPILTVLVPRVILSPIIANLQGEAGNCSNRRSPREFVKSMSLRDARDSHHSHVEGVHLTSQSERDIKLRQLYVPFLVRTIIQLPTRANTPQATSKFTHSSIPAHRTPTHWLHELSSRYLTEHTTKSLRNHLHFDRLATLVVPPVAPYTHVGFYDQHNTQSTHVSQLEYSQPHHTF